MSRMNNLQRANLLDAVTQALLSWKRREITVAESISRSPAVGGHDRHFATTSTFSFVLEHAMWAISGGRLILHGTDPRFRYEVAFDAVSSGSVSQSEVKLVESFGSIAERVSKLSVAQGEVVSP
jgi:hypothetical protein